MRRCSVVLTFESVDKILWCDHSNETSLEALFHGAICFSIFFKMKFEIFLALILGTLGAKKANRYFTTYVKLYCASFPKPCKE